jgi:hypothetical protein
MMVPPFQPDPINSPHPVPWNWVMVMLGGQPGRYLYRTQGLISPNQQLVSYSRIQLQVMPLTYQSHITSVLFVENLETGNIQVITPTSPLAASPFATDSAEGTFSMVIPIAWSEGSDRLLAREFEGALYSDVASDYGVIVDLPQQTLSTICPSGENAYTTAVLLGWSAQDADCALFEIRQLGQALPHQVLVNRDGKTEPAEGDRPLGFGEWANSVWSGPQSEIA